MPTSYRVSWGGDKNRGLKPSLRADYPEELGKHFRGYLDIRLLVESLFADAIQLGISDPDDPQIKDVIFAGMAIQGMSNRPAFSGLQRRLVLAQGDYPECYFELLPEVES